MTCFAPGRLVARHFKWIVGLAVALACALSAAPASAVMVRLPTGGYANYQLMKGARLPSMRPNPFDTAFSNLDYSGGPVMHSNTNYVVEWLPSGYSGTPFQSASGYSLDYVGGMTTFLNDLAHDSGATSNVDSVAAQYNDTSGSTAAYNSHYGGLLLDTDSFPASGCTANTGDVCLTDAQIQQELDSFLASQHVPADLAHEYFLLTPPDVESCFDSTGSAGCSANQPTNPAYCAYHSQTAVGGYVYSNIPDLSGNGGCDPFGFYSYNNGPADGMLSAVSHEHIESITDPQPNNAWTDWQPGCVSGGPVTCGGEIGDKCNGDALNSPNLQYGSSFDQPYNQTINGDHYLLQMQWSNQQTSLFSTGNARCIDDWSTNGNAAHASFTATPTSGNAVSFNATGSSATGGVAEYVWQFNDNSPANGTQNYTVETTSPTISHTFPNPGTYTAALTVMGSDGTSNGAAHSVTAGTSGGTAPTAAFTDNAPVLEGNAVSFNSSGSSDPNPGGTLSYSWNFGDGGTSTAANPSHTYSHFGSYTATLTVTDSASSLTNAVSHSVTITDEAPSAAFTSSPSSPTTSTPVSFNGGGSSDSDGHIAGYSWDFGDGSPAGTGVSPSHTYASSGPKTVTLTVTDSDGGTATISHTVTVASTTPPVAPTAAFADNAPALEGNAVSFNSSGSSDPNPGGTLSYSWNFGDGGTSTAANPSHTYGTSGSYTVTLVVTDSASSLTSSVNHAVTITDEAPTAGFSAPTGTAGQPVSFLGAGSDPDGSIMAYSWQFGDNGSASGASPQHTYHAPGDYTVTLTVVDASGRSASTSHMVTISSAPVVCVVPTLKGKTQAQAKKALRTAHCSLGKAHAPKKPKHQAGKHKHWALVVAKQGTPGGRVEPEGFAVNVTLTWKALHN